MTCRAPPPCARSSTSVRQLMGPSSFGLADQLRLPGRSESDVRGGIEEELILRELQAERQSERRPVEADLRGERVVSGPGPAGCRGLGGEHAVGQIRLPPRLAGTGEALGLLV